jgi:hypothetical protein
LLLLPDLLLLAQLHVQSYNQLQHTDEAVECGLSHLSELGVRLLQSMPPELEAWCHALDPEDESSFDRHPVLHQPLMSDPIDIVSMHILSVMVRSQHDHGCNGHERSAVPMVGG